ncbi:altronate hydrolase [Enterococcus sp. AZ194]|uniref:UxaA family hydrolase n=1 Tax=Enterococcus sp. AZ194 TaxID=2774629 RepID=UPI003F27F00C
MVTTITEKKASDLLTLNIEDNVAVALHPIAKGTIFHQPHSLTVNQDIPQGHKIALWDINKGDNVIKYGYPIGHAIKDIKAGDWLHTHNLKTNLAGELTYTYKPDLRPVSYEKRALTFDGYRRANNKVGIRNDLLIVPTVGCINGMAELMVQQFKQNHPDLGTFDNVTILKHPYGCSQLGKDHKNTQKVLIDAVQHPNAGSVLVFGLGCENNTVKEFKESLGEYDPSRIKFLVAQEVEDEVDTGVRLLEELYLTAKEDHREPIALSELTIGLKCGGSDGFSGITANPLLGAFSDFLIAQGGSSVLTEVPEMFGAEQVLMARAKNKEVFEEIVHLINDFKEYFLSFGEPIYENPSPGNKDGGITTLEDKSLGCTQKSGTSAVVDVLHYGDKVKEKGLSLLEGPGNDLVAASALASADCQLVLFTTGRGTPFGAYVPTMKVATNTQIFDKKGHWMDFNAGRLLNEPMAVVLEDFIQAIIDVASGRQTRNESNDVREIAIFKNGVTL